MDEPIEYLHLAVLAALEAGKAIMKIYTDPNADFEIERKADNSPLTLADRAAHAVIAAQLADTPYPLLSEEGRNISYAERKDWPILWVVDPLDGTKEFIKRNGEFTVNIACVKNGVPVMGVIYVPVRNELYCSADGLGAFKVTDVQVDDYEGLDELLMRAVKLPLAAPHKGIVVVASRSHLSEETEQFINELRLHTPDVTMKSSGSSLKICLVAEGSADVYPRFAPTMEWDTAAGHAIARGAGMEIYQAGKANETNEPLRYNKEDLLNPWFIVEQVRNAQ
ncbi:MAG: 3'(2'),5'-bisphosphate nucleotidase CysQ [Tannerellaceae bacterium]